MAEITADRVYETSTTTGAGSYTLAGAISGYRAFSAVCANGDTVRCFVEEVDANGVPNGGWEVGIYTWATGGVLARTTIEASSNSNAAVSWSAGTRRIGLGATASKLGVFVSVASNGAVILGGNNNLANGANSVAMGVYATTRNMQGAVARASGNLASTAGQRQTRSAVLCRNTISNTATALTTDAGNPSTTNQFILPNATTLRIRGQVVVWDANSDKSGGWDVSAVLVSTFGGTVSLQGSVVVSAYQGDASLSACTVTVVADNTNKAAQLQVTGLTSTTLRWVGEFTTAELGA